MVEAGESCAELEGMTVREYAEMGSSRGLPQRVTSWEHRELNGRY